MVAHYKILIQRHYSRTHLHHWFSNLHGLARPLKIFVTTCRMISQQYQIKYDSVTQIQNIRLVNDGRQGYVNQDRKTCRMTDGIGQPRTHYMSLCVLVFFFISYFYVATKTQRYLGLLSRLLKNRPLWESLLPSFINISGTNCAVKHEQIVLVIQIITIKIGEYLPR